MLKFIEAILLGIFSTAISLFVPRFYGNSDGVMIAFVIVTAILTGFYYIVIENYEKSAAWFKREVLRYALPKIGILNGQINSCSDYPCVLSWAGVRPLQWRLSLTAGLRKDLRFGIVKILLFFIPKFVVKEIKVSEIDDRYLIIINPFGDNYPEQDTELFVTFFKIREFMRNGGVFIGTGGVFFWQQNTAKKPSVEQTIIRQQITTGGTVQSLEDTLLCKKFGIRTTGDGPEENTPRELYQLEGDKAVLGDFSSLLKENKFRRFRSLTKDATCNYVPLVREKERDYYPVALVNFGRGFMVHLGLHIINHDSPEFKLASEVIKQLIFKRRV